MKCKHSKNGCNFEQMPLKKQVLNDHEKECEHRTIMCLYAGCNENISLSKFMHHFETASYMHYLRIITISVPIIEEGNTHQYNRTLTLSPKDLELSQTWLTWLTYHREDPSTRPQDRKQNFYSEWARSPTGFFFMWVYLIGTPKEAENFTYTITFFNVNNEVIFDINLNLLGHLH